MEATLCRSRLRRPVWQSERPNEAELVQRLQLSQAARAARRLRHGRHRHGPLRIKRRMDDRSTETRRLRVLRPARHDTDRKKVRSSARFCGSVPRAINELDGKSTTSQKAYQEATAGEIGFRSVT